MVSEAQVMEDLQSTLESGYELDILVQFRGMPFICHAHVVDLTAETVRLQAYGAATVLLKADEMVRVWGIGLQETALARIIAADLENSELELGEFSYQGSALDKRMDVRVEPKFPLLVEIIHPNFQVTGQMVDISMLGMGLHLAHSDANIDLETGVELILRTTLPTGAFEATGTLLNIINTAQHLRLSIQFNQDIPHKKTLFQYLVERRSEIESELHKLYETSLQSE